LTAENLSLDFLFRFASRQNEKRFRKYIFIESILSSVEGLIKQKSIRIKEKELFVVPTTRIKTSFTWIPALLNH